MKQVELERAVARVTGESLTAIQRFGFHLEESEDSFAAECDAREPLFIDWDEYEAQRNEGRSRRPWYAPTAA